MEVSKNENDSNFTVTELPKNLKDWPTDCFEIFGLSRSANRKELRRAYFGLIKKYRPDSEPEAFQRIHQAYESAQLFLKTTSADTATSTDSTSDTRNDSHQNQQKRHDAQETKEAPETTDTPSPSSPTCKNQDRSDSRPLSRFWELASKGLWEETAATVPMIQQPRDRRLAEFSQYFLQRAASIRHEPYQSEKRIEILLKLLDQQSIRDNVLFYLANEFRSRPELAKVDAVSNLISKSADRKYTHELARLRWKAIGVDSPELVMSDMACFQEHFSKDVNHSAAEALEYTIWHPSSEFDEHNEKCLQIVDDSDSWLADIGEFLSLAAKECSGKTITLWEDNDVGQLLPYCRTGFPSAMESKWQPIVSALNDNRRKSLEKLKTLEKRFPLSTSLFCSGLQRFAGEAAQTHFVDYPSEKTVKNEVAVFLRGLDVLDFENKHRVTTAEFCIENRISPTRLGIVFDAFTSQRRENLLWRDVFQRDLAFHCIYYAGIADLL